MIKIEIDCLSIKHKELILPNILENIYNNEEAWKIDITNRSIHMSIDADIKDLIIVPIYYDEINRFTSKFLRKTFDVIVSNGSTEGSVYMIKCQTDKAYNRIRKFFKGNHAYEEGKITTLLETNDSFNMSFYEGCNFYPGFYIKG